MREEEFLQLSLPLTTCTFFHWVSEWDLGVHLNVSEQDNLCTVQLMYYVIYDSNVRVFMNFFSKIHQESCYFHWLPLEIFSYYGGVVSHMITLMVWTHYTCTVHYKFTLLLINKYFYQFTVFCTCIWANSFLPFHPIEP